MTVASTVRTCSPAGAAPPPENRRGAFRLVTAIALQARADGDEPHTECWSYDRGVRLLDTFTEDVSVRGLRFRAPQALEPGARVQLRAEIEQERTDLECRVVRADTDLFGASIAVAFDAPGEAVWSRLSRLVIATQRRRLPCIPGAHRVRCELDDSHQLVRGTTSSCSPGFVEMQVDGPIRPGEHITVAVTVHDVVAVLQGVAITGRGQPEHWQSAIEIADPPARWTDLLDAQHHRHATGSR